MSQTPICIPGDFRDDSAGSTFPSCRRTSPRHRCTRRLLLQRRRRQRRERQRLLRKTCRQRLIFPIQARRNFILLPASMLWGWRKRAKRPCTAATPLLKRGIPVQALQSMGCLQNSGLMWKGVDCRVPENRRLYPFGAPWRTMKIYPKKHVLVETAVRSCSKHESISLFHASLPL